MALIAALRVAEERTVRRHRRQGTLRLQPAPPARALRRAVVASLEVHVRRRSRLRIARGECEAGAAVVA
eukprot:4845387-Prymnesium_polylepis.1